MYKISDQQIDFILNDIRARGVEMESLQNDLLDHICCIIENQLEASGDFEHFYFGVVTTFYKKELREIEEETISLLNNKNYYTMKKVMIVSGIASAILLTIGIILKFMHAPGAAVGIVLGTVMFSFLFLPLMFMLKLKEKEQTKDKILLGLGTFASMLISMAVLFKIMHWPGANISAVVCIGVLILVYLPINLVTGIRNPLTKTNTIVSSVLLIAGCGLFLSLARSPQGSKIQYLKDTGYFVRYDRIVKNERMLLEKLSSERNNGRALNEKEEQIFQQCEKLKSYLIEKETGVTALDESYEGKQLMISETYTNVYVGEFSPPLQEFQKLDKLIKEYNASQLQTNRGTLEPIPVKVLSMTESSDERVLQTLNTLDQVELYLLQNARTALEMKKAG